MLFRAFHVGLFLPAVLSTVAAAQIPCANVWQSTGVPAGVTGSVRSLTVWDPDGPGGLSDQPVIGGLFQRAGGNLVRNIAHWDGSNWRTFGSGTNGTVLALTNWDPDGSGPLSTQLIAGGNFSMAGGTPVGGIARWDGASWQAFSTGMSGTVSALTTWDPDGPGPLSPVLVAGGAFATAGGTTVNNIAYWDGATWQPFDAGFDGPVLSLTTWDPDGPGPLPTQLIAGGSFANAGLIPVANIARWTGAAWAPLGAGVDGPVRSLTVWDPDGSGPMPLQLVAGGTFANAGTGSASNIAHWDGVSWQSFAGGMDSTVFALTTLSHSATLIAGGSFTEADGTTVNNAASWDGATWQPFDDGSDGTVLALTPWDFDGGGPSSPILVLGGFFSSVDGLTANGVARWDGSSWATFGRGMDDSVLSLTTWDRDGNGPANALLVAGGDFVTAGGLLANGIAKWDGASWTPFDTGMDDTVYALTTWDPDGSGSLSPQLVAGGAFSTAGGASANYLARWDGVAWQPLGDGVDSTVFALTTWDPDGTGPASALLIAGGEFSNAGNTPANEVAAWDGVAWQALGGGMDGAVDALISWDPDGPGPLPAQLVAAGDFINAEGMTVNHIAHWNGVAWLPFGDGTGMDGSVLALTLWDPDGPGPTPPLLVAAGDFSTAGGTAVGGVTYWDGVAWQPFGSGTDGSVYAATTWDPDGPGPEIPQLIVGGSFSMAGTNAARAIARWDGSDWQPLDSGADEPVQALTTWDPDGPLLRRIQLAVGGGFVAPGGVPSAFAALYGCPRTPCPADFNENGIVSVQDIFDFLAAWFQHLPSADINGSGQVTVQDLFDFLAAWFRGCL